MRKKITIKRKVADKIAKTKIAKKVIKVKFINNELKKNILTIEIAKIFSDNTSKIEKYNLNKLTVNKLLSANCQKEFASIVNNEFVKVAMLDAQAKKQQLTVNTQYCTSRNYVALALNRLQYAEVAFKQRHEAQKILKNVKAKKQKKQVKKSKKQVAK